MRGRATGDEAGAKGKGKGGGRKEFLVHEMRKPKFRGPPSTMKYIILKKEYRRIVGGVGEEDGPRISNPLVELDVTSRSIGLKVGGDVTEAKGNVRHA